MRRITKRLSGLGRTQYIVFGAAGALVLFVVVILVVATLRGSGSTRIGLTVHSDLGILDVSRGMAPNIEVTDLNGVPVSLSAMRGKVVMVEFWSSWCVECQREAPVIADAYAKWRDKGVEFIGIAIWDNEQSTRSFVERFRLTYPVAVHEGTLSAQYGVTGIPEKFFVDGDGRIVKRVIGALTAEDLDNLLTELTGA